MKRILIYALQSSGASLFAYYLGQSQSYQRTLCIPDLWNGYLAPALNEDCDAVILKAVTTTNFSLDQHIESFKPTDVILFERNYSDVIESLERKSYATKGGDIDEKISIFKSEVEKSRFPVVHYDSFIPIVKVGQFPVSKSKMIEANSFLSSWAFENLGKQWGFGGIDFQKL